ncbi:hypothetical protein [Runella sp.]|uniref:hypothetical protein n=1 Tax=Runella sp. TaxID=1960881 RepID=UPI003D0C90BE
MKTEWLKWTVPVITMAFLTLGCKDNNDLPDRPDPIEEAAPKLKKAVGSATDFQQFKYDSDGRITQYVSQWQFVQSDPSQIRRLEQNFVYNAAGQLTTLSSDAGIHNYVYKNGVLEKVESRSANRLISTTYFLFDAKGQVAEREEVVPEEHRLPDAPAKTKWKYTYDAKGNCVHTDYFLFMEDSYKLYESIDYSEFDTSGNPFDLLSFYPYVPWVKFHVNNPGKQTTSYASGGEPAITTYRYQYNSKGIPTQRTITQNGADWTVKLEY